MSYYPYPKYLPVAEREAKAQKKIKQLKKKNPDISPVVIVGRAIANTWWGREWNSNLERYADFSNRIGRGRSYVRHGAVLDLRIGPGKVNALVQGSTSKPYEVTIDIKKIEGRNWRDIKQACRGNMDNMQHLIAGKFPKKLATVFTCKGSGLFPSPDEIKFSCSCPDSAYMCKHVAAVLYGIGARLDTDPALFFTLREADINSLISETIHESKQEILLKSNSKTSRVIEDEESLSEMFGIELAENPERQKTDRDVEKRVKSEVTTKKKRELPPTSKATPTSKAVQTSEAASTPERTSTGKGEAILKILKRRRRAMSVSDILAETDSSMSDQQVRNTLYRLKEQGLIKNSSRGIYQII